MPWPRSLRAGHPHPGRLLAWGCLHLLLISPAQADSGSEAEWRRWPALVVEPDFSFETGAGLTHASVWLLGKAEEGAFRPLEGRAAAGAGRGGTWGVLPRAARALLFDAPVAWWFGVLQHEMFGHGGRAREFGSHASIRMGDPWGGRDSYATFGAAGLSNEDLLRVYAGGSESNGWTATLLERDMVAGRAMHPLEMWYVAASRFVTSDYVLRTTPNPATDPEDFFGEWQGGGDVANYLGFLSRRYEGAPGIAPGGASGLVVTEHRRLRRQARLNALDPGAWLALWGAARWIAHGSDPAAVPLPRARGRRFLPILSSDWLPDGGVASLELIVGGRPAAKPGTAHELDREAEPDAGAGGRAARWSSFTLRRGRGPGGAIVAAGAAAERLTEIGSLRLGGEVELWNRPRHGLGGGVRVRIVPTRGGWRGLFFDLGVKSDGHWIGRPAGTGAFILLGLRAD